MGKTEGALHACLPRNRLVELSGLPRDRGNRSRRRGEGESGHSPVALFVRLFAMGPLRNGAPFPFTRCY